MSASWSTTFTFLRTPDGSGVVELMKFHAPAHAHRDPGPVAPNAPGLRHLAFAVEGMDPVVAGPRSRGAELVGEVMRGTRYRLWFVRGPDDLIVEVMEPIG